MQNLEKFIGEELKDIKKDIKELKAEVTKYKGFVGGVLWTVAAAFTAFQFIVKWLNGTHS